MSEPDSKRVARNRIFETKEESFETETFYLPTATRSVPDPPAPSPPCTTQSASPNPDQQQSSSKSAERILRQRIFTRPDLEAKPTVPDKEPEKPSACCINDCKSVTTVDEKLEIKNFLKTGTKIGTKNVILSHLHSQDRLGHRTDQFRWRTNYLCLNNLSELSALSVYVLQDVFRSHRLGKSEIVHGNQGVPKEFLPTSKFLVWMLDFARRYGQSAPDAEVIVLNHWLTKKTMFEIYSAESEAPLASQL